MGSGREEMTGEPGTSKTVVIVEDNDIEREGMAAVLRQAGYAPWPAPNVDVALACPETTGGSPNLILLDMIMPGKDGWRFLELRRKQPALASVPVIIVTGLGVASQEWGTSLGAVAVLKKPFGSEELLREVSKII
jgi:CheY-like chemotaxis protein